MAAASSSSHASRAHGSEELSWNFSRAVDEVGARSAMVVMVPESIRVEEEEAAAAEEEEEEEQEESEWEVSYRGRRRRRSCRFEV